MRTTRLSKIAALRRTLSVPLVALALAAVAAGSGHAAGTGVTTTVYGPSSTSSTSAAAQQACAAPPAGEFQCLAEFIPGAAPNSASTRAGASPDTAQPTGYSPAQLQDAYKLTQAVDAGRGTGETVALVDAYDDPTAESDLAVYRSTFGLPACTTADGCFTKEGQTGSTTALPPVDGDWAVEISLDLDMVSAACPDCRILLVEADQPSLADLAAAEDQAAATPGVVAISNSWSGAENQEDYQYSAAFDHPGIAITASSGDSGYQLAAGFPGTLTTVISVGGTELVPAPGTARGWTETAWNTVTVDGDATGSWCSAWVARPSWQHDPICSGRSSADVAADADPGTGPSVYDSTPYNGTTYDWLRVGGTSASSPFIAGVYALAGDTSRIDDASGLYARDHQADLYPVTSGDNITKDTCGESLICTASPGFNAVTGNGTPDGIGAF